MQEYGFTHYHIVWLICLNFPIVDAGHVLHVYQLEFLFSCHIVEDTTATESRAGETSLSHTSCIS